MMTLKEKVETAENLVQLITDTRLAKKTVTWAELAGMLDLTGAVFVEAIRKERARVTQLEARIVTLEARPLQKWAGTHVAGTQYAEASLVTKSGSLWVSTATTTTTPGEPGSDWRLIVKRGQA